MSAHLSVHGLCKSFRGLRAVDQVSFNVAPGSIVALIGSNGAGKTTVFNMVAGATAPDAGEIVFNNHAIHGLRPDQVCHLGLARTFQIVKPFGGLTVLDNVVVGALKRCSRVTQAREEAEQVLEALSLGAKRDMQATSLTLPDRKRLEVARALATKPQLLLLDEAMAGLRPAECDTMIEFLRSINRREGIGILLIEHVMRAVTALAEVVIVLHHGQIIAQGKPEQIAQDPAVLECYLGEDIEL
jgi:branched-chain amino acid transport system ATP-binding protein